VTKFYFVKEHRLHGVVTGLESVRILGSLDDKLDRLLISFKDAKVSHYSVCFKLTTSCTAFASFLLHSLFLVNFFVLLNQPITSH
jgi:hypothetical protein